MKKQGTTDAKKRAANDVETSDTPKAAKARLRSRAFFCSEATSAHPLLHVELPEDKPRCDGSTCDVTKITDALTLVTRQQASAG
jgi:hypothetical protein